MRPCTLTISSFGPYGGEVFLDFSLLRDSRIFLITGPTGSGKSFIFDAMFYALYGVPGQQDRSNTALRSDFTPAGDDRRSFVRLEFSLGKRHYRIERYPAQEVPYKYKEGFRQQNASVAFYDLQTPEQPPLTNTSEVQQRIEELVGLTADQFKKIVMIPQGSFQEFLLAKTQEKQGILRHIFGTELYLRAQRRLSERANQINTSFKERAQAFRIHLGHLSWREDRPIIEAGHQEMQLQVAEEIAKDRLELKALTKERCDLDEDVKTRNTDLQAAEKHNEAIQEWKIVETKLNALEEQTAAMTALTQRIAMANAAKDAVAKEENARIYQEQAEEALAHLTQLQKETTQSEDAFEKRQEAYVELEAQIKAMEALEKSIPTRKQQLKDVAYLESVQKQYLDAMEKLDVLEKAHSAYRDQIGEGEKKQGVLDERLKGIRRELQKEAALSVKKATLDTELKNLRHALRLLEEQKEEASALSRARAELKKQEATEESAQLAWREGQAEERHQSAYTLARQLVEGAPCPVCGSVDHPKPADRSNLSGKTDLADLENQWIVAQKMRQKAEQKVMTLQGAYDARSHQLQDKGLVIQEDVVSWQAHIEKVTALGKEKKTDYLACENSLKRLKALREEDMEKEKVLEELRKQLGHLKDSLEKSREALDRTRIETKSREQEIQRLRAQLPEALPGLEGLQQTLDTDEKKISDFRIALENAQKSYNQAKLDLAQKKTARDSARLQHTKDAELAQMKQDAFEAERLKHFVEMDQYDVAREDIPMIESLEKALQSWQDEKRLYHTQIEGFIRRYEKKDLKDTEGLRNALQKAEERSKECRDAEVRLDAQIREHEVVHQKLKDLADECDALEEAYKLHNQCADILRGDNPLRMDMETYVLVHYFEKVLAAANMRLHQMTAGRYSFQRRQAVRDRRKQAGLELDVMDYYTGKARDVSTLSGGERFKASLSLALGLSDVVGTESGGIRLSTMFIDEGFGTLDADSLDQTLDTLIALQAHGRLVGIISHVPELKERIPAQLVVEQTPEGSRAAFKVKG